MAKVLIVQPIAEEGVKLLQDQGYTVKQLADASIDNLKKEVVDSDAILIRTGEISREVIAAAKNLKVIARHGAGVDNIDLKSATEHGVQVTNTPIANNISVAEHTIGLMVALAKQIRKADLALREGRFEVRNIYIDVELAGKILGVIGLGKIGQQVASKAARGFDMKVLGFDPFLSQAEVDTLIEVTDDWERVFKEADFISLNLPLNEQTRDMIGKKEFAMMKDTAFLINCARGQIVKEEDLIEALERGEIAGAGLDVYATEPPSKDNLLFKLENTIVTPHMAAHSYESMVKMACHAAQGIIEVLNKQEPTWPVNIIKKGVFDDGI